MEYWHRTVCKSVCIPSKTRDKSQPDKCVQQSYCLWYALYLVQEQNNYDRFIQAVNPVTCIFITKILTGHTITRTYRKVYTPCTHTEHDLSSNLKVIISLGIPLWHSNTIIISKCDDSAFFVCTHLTIQETTSQSNEGLPLELSRFLSTTDWWNPDQCTPTDIINCICYTKVCLHKISVLINNQ